MRVKPRLMTGRAAIWLAAVVVSIFVDSRSMARAQALSDFSSGPAGEVQFNSVTPQNFAEALRGKDKLTEVTISGHLLLPDRAERVPAMIVKHGSGGAGTRELEWARRFTGWGIAAFVVDSFTPRGVRETATAAGQLNIVADVADSFAALRLLASHPRIDAGRIGIIGFSRGGTVALLTSFVPMRHGLLNTDGRFALHVALYPNCSTRYTGPTSGAPIVLRLGGADDWTPAAHCLAYGKVLEGLGSPVDAAVYPGAPHGFDSQRRTVLLPHVRSSRNCETELDLVTLRFRRLDTGAWLVGRQEIENYYARCITHGAHVGGDSTSLDRAIADVKKAVTAAFRL